MKKIRLILCSTAFLSLVFISGCVNNTNLFKDKGKHLLNSRRVGYRKQLYQQQPTVRYDFDSEKIIEELQTVNGQWHIKEGKLWAVSGNENRTVLIAECLAAPFKIEFEATNYANTDGSIGDITVLINSENSKQFFTKGYTLTTGSYYNNCTTFYRLGKPFAKTEFSPLVSGKTYNVSIEYAHGHIRYWLDDKIILEAWDPKPLTLSPKQWIGIRTWNTKMAIDNFAIYQISK